MTSPCPVLAGYRLVRSRPCACLSSMYVQNLPATHVSVVVGLHSLPSVLDYFLVSLSFYGLPYSRLGLAWRWALLFLQPTLFPATISCHTTLSFLLRSCFTSIWLCLFGLAVHSSPNGPARLLVLLLPHWWAPVSHLFSLGCLEPICFPWASSALFLTLHYHGLLLNSLGFPGPITLFLILGVHGLTIDPLLFLFSLLWAGRGPFSLFHIINCPYCFFSLSGLL